MIEGMNPTPTRRHVITGVAMALGTLAAGGKSWAKTQQQMQEAPSTVANHARTSLHQEVDFKATPQRIYEILLDSKQFAAFTGMPAEIDPKAGGSFSMFGDLIVGRNVELLPNQRIVQAWRPTHWDSGVYSVVKFELKPQALRNPNRSRSHRFPRGRIRPPRPWLEITILGPVKKICGLV